MPGMLWCWQLRAGTAESCLRSEPVPHASRLWARARRCLAPVQTAPLLCTRGHRTVTLVCTCAQVGFKEHALSATDFPSFLRNPALSEALETAERRYPFKVYPPASLAYGTAAPLCNHAGERETILSAAPLSADVPALLVIGAQKAGTTWLWGALSRHSAFVGAKTCAALT